MKWKWKIIQAFWAEGLESHPREWLGPIDKFGSRGRLCVSVPLVLPPLSWSLDYVILHPHSLPALAGFTWAPWHPALSAPLLMARPVTSSALTISSAPPGQPFSSITPRTAPPLKPVAMTPLFLVTISLPFHLQSLSEISMTWPFLPLPVPNSF